MTAGTTPQPDFTRPDVAAALEALIASPIGALLDAMLPTGVLAEIGGVLGRAIAADATARAEATEAQRVMRAELDVQKARSEAVEGQLAAMQADRARLASSLEAAEFEIARLTAQLGRVRRFLGDISENIADVVEGLDEVPDTELSKQMERAGSAGSLTSGSGVLVTVESSGAIARSPMGPRAGCEADRGPEHTASRDEGRRRCGAAMASEAAKFPATDDVARLVES